MAGDRTGFKVNHLPHGTFSKSANIFQAERYNFYSKTLKGVHKDCYYYVQGQDDGGGQMIPSQIHYTHPDSIHWINYRRWLMPLDDDLLHPTCTQLVIFYWVEPSCLHLMAKQFSPAGTTSASLIGINEFCGLLTQRVGSWVLTPDNNVGNENH